MNKLIKEAKLSKKEKEANIIEEILSEWEDDVNNRIKDPSCKAVSISSCMFIWVNGIWTYDIDHTFLNTKLDLWKILKILQQINDAGIKNITISAGSQTIFNSKHEYVGFFNWDEGFDIILEKNNNLTEKQVESILKKKAIKEYKEYLKKKENNVN